MSRKLAGAKATGSFILVEMLDAQETLGTMLQLSQRTQVNSPQGYILDIGPALDKAQWGIEVGDRVLLQGSYVPVPKFGDRTREWGIVQPHDIKCVLQEESPIVLESGE